MIIYRITNLVNQKVYIGQTSKSLSDRYKTHCSKWSRCYKLRNAIQKYGKENFVIEPLMAGLTSQEELNFWETFWIKVYDSVKEGYNLNPIGGPGNFSYRTLETRDKISKALKGKKHNSEENLAKSLRQKGMTRGEEAKVNMSKGKRKKNPDLFYISKHRGLYSVIIYHERKSVYIGCFPTIEEAKLKRDLYLENLLETDICVK